MAQVTNAANMKDALVEYKIGTGQWTDFGGAGNEVSPDGFERAKGEAFTFDGDTPVVLKGKRGSGSVTVRILYTEGANDPYITFYNAYLDGDDVQIRWSPLGGGTGAFQFTSAPRGFVDKGLPPGGEAGNADPTMIEFSVSCAFIDQAVIV